VSWWRRVADHRQRCRGQLRLEPDARASEPRTSSRVSATIRTRSTGARCRAGCGCTRGSARRGARHGWRDEHVLRVALEAEPGTVPSTQHLGVAQDAAQMCEVVRDAAASRPPPASSRPGAAAARAARARPAAALGESRKFITRAPTLGSSRSCCGYSRSSATTRPVAHQRLDSHTLPGERIISARRLSSLPHGG